jgi:hypothetical protein
VNLPICQNDLARVNNKHTGWYFYSRRYIVFSGHYMAATAHCLVVMACRSVAMPHNTADINQITRRYAPFRGSYGPLQPGIGTLTFRYERIQAS